VTARAESQISNYYFMNRFTNRAPDVALSLSGDGVIEGGAEPVVKGTVRLSISTSELSRSMLQDQRFEVVIYMDDILLVEDESGYFPYNWNLETASLPDGPHVVTVNIATLSDQVGTSSQKIVVKNK
jgi:hypothetical protein